MLSVPVLADIWSGAIVFWNDSAIAALNPEVPELPFQPIFLVYGDDRRATLSDVFAEALADFNPAFKMTNNSFANTRFQFGSIPVRSTVVASGPTQLGATAVPPLLLLSNLRLTTLH